MDHPMRLRADTTAYTEGLEAHVMFDLLMLLLLAVASTGAVGYVRVCANLTRLTGATPGQLP
jgi:hypothetical protein